MAVSIERFIGIRSPMQARLQWRDGKIKILIISIFVGAFIVTFYHHIAYKYSIHILCNDTQLRGNVIPVSSFYNNSHHRFIFQHPTPFIIIIIQYNLSWKFTIETFYDVKLAFSDIRGQIFCHNYIIIFKQFSVLL